MENDETPKRNKGGRPKTRLGAPKSASFTARISQEIRDAMTSEAARTGRSIADVAEMWLEDARRGRASVDAQLGGSKAASVLRQMASLAVLVEKHVGDPDTSKAAQFALMEGWALLTRTTLKPLLPTSLELAVTAAREKVYRRYVEAFILYNQYAEVAGSVSAQFTERQIEDTAIETMLDCGMTDGDRLADLLWALSEFGEFPSSEKAKAALSGVISEVRLEDEKILSNHTLPLEILFKVWQPKGPLTNALLNIIAAEKALIEAIADAQHEDEIRTETGRQFIATMLGLADSKGHSIDDNIATLSNPPQYWPHDK